MNDLTIIQSAVIVFVILIVVYLVVLNRCLVKKNDRLRLDNLRLNIKKSAIFICLSSVLMNYRVSIFDELFDDFDEADIDKLSVIMLRYIRINSLKDHAAVDVYNRLKAKQTDLIGGE